jgi:diguanylate cyclase (GGDEF)-like protein
MSILNRLSFKWQISLFFTVAMVVMLGITSWIQYLTAENTLRTKQIDQGIKWSVTFAQQSALAVLYNSPENAQETMQAMLKFPDVVSVEIFRPNRTRLAFAGERIFTPTAKPDFDQAVKDGRLDFEDDQIWSFLAPVVRNVDRDDPFAEDLEESVLGFVRINLSKASLNQIAREHLYVNALATIGLAVIFMTLLLVFAARLTKPIQQLVSVMDRVQSGERQLKAEASGSRDVKILAGAFNSMSKARDAEEIEMRVARDLANETAKMKMDFTAKVTHELRTPMNGIMGTIDLIEDEGGLSPKQTELVGVLHRSADILLEFITDILDFSKADAGALKLVKDDFYLIDIAQSIVDMLIGEASRKEINLGIDMDLDLPDLVHGDSGKIRQILTNLIGNAIKFTSAGDVLLRIEIVEQLENLVTYRFSVEDSGIGIPEDVLGNIFEPFSQGNLSSTNDYTGTGLGLTISKQLVELMGGSLTVESQVGAGSKFSFTVPFEVARDDIRTNIEKYRPEVAGLRILVVDESPVNRNIMTGIFKRWYAYHQECQDGKTALLKLRQAAARHKHFDFVIIDQQTTGYQSLVTQITGDSGLAKTKIIMSFSANKLGKSEAIELGVAGTVDRPVRDMKLYQVVISIMNAKGGPKYLPVQDQHELLPLQRRVLVVEDTVTNQIVIEEILTRLGCSVDKANNGQDAVSNYFDKEYDLILMDCRMPVIDGYEATRMYRSQEGNSKHTPIVAMTANVADENNRQLAIDAGMDDYVSKPVSIKAIKTVLAKWANDAGQSAASDLPASYPAEVDGLQIARMVYSELVDTVGENAVKKMTQSFCRDLPVQLAALSTASASGDRKTMLEVAHSLKSASQNFGAQEFAEIARIIEQNSSHERLEVLEELAESLRKNGAALEIELNHMVELQGQLSTNPSYRILIAEDNESERIALANCLRDENLVIETVNNGSAAIKYCQVSLPDLVLMDALMPEEDVTDMDGFRACRMIKQLPGGATTPVLMVTGLNDQESINMAMDAGAADFISKPINYKSLQHRVTHILSSSHSERQLQKIAFTDTLTGLPNRAHFVHQLSEQIKDTRGATTLAAIVFVGLDSFSLINKGIGHSEGDLLLQTVAKRLKLQVSENVFAARTSGDEFGFVLQGFLDQDEIEVFVQQVRDELAQPYHIVQEQINISATLGISIYPQHGKDLSILMKRADTAMYEAKQKRLPYLFYDDGMGRVVSEQFKVLASLPEAIEKDKLSLVFQPQYSVERDEIDGCEALVRWNTPQNGVLFPAAFINYAEESGLIVQLGEWVILNTCKQLTKWRESGLPSIKCSINLSIKQLEDPDLTNRVAEVLNATGADPAQIDFEITESALMTNTQQCMSALTELKSMGFGIAIDDFGTGYNTFVYLDKLPIDIIKIDRSFTSRLSGGEESNVIQTMLGVARGMNFIVVAEGVETEYQKEYLIGQGCHYIQGYLIGKPVSAAVFEQTILRKRLRDGSTPTAVASISQGSKNHGGKNRKLN